MKKGLILLLAVILIAGASLAACKNVGGKCAAGKKGKVAAKAAAKSVAPTTTIKALGAK